MLNCHEMFIYDEEYDSGLEINGTGDSENELGNYLFKIFNYFIIKLRLRVLFQ